MQPEQISNDRAERTLEVSWADGVTRRWSHRQVRSACRCSPCQAARLRGTVPLLPDDVVIEEIRPIGHYAVQLVFSDGHERGIYPWELLRTLSE